MKKRYLATASGRLISFPEGNDIAVVRDRLKKEDYEVVYGANRQEAKRQWVISQLIGIVMERGEMPGFFM